MHTVETCKPTFILILSALYSDMQSKNSKLLSTLHLRPKIWLDTKQRGKAQTS